MDDIPQILVTLGGHIPIGTIHGPVGTPDFFTTSHALAPGRICHWSLGVQCFAGLQGGLVSGCHQHRLVHGGIFDRPPFDASISTKKRKTGSLDFYWGSGRSGGSHVPWPSPDGVFPENRASSCRHCSCQRPGGHHRCDPGDKRPGRIFSNTGKCCGHQRCLGAHRVQFFIGHGSGALRKGRGMETLFSSAFGKLVEPYCWDSFWVALWPI